MEVIILGNPYYQEYGTLTPVVIPAYEAEEAVIKLTTGYDPYIIGSGTASDSYWVRSGTNLLKPILSTDKVVIGGSSFLGLEVLRVIGGVNINSLVFSSESTFVDSIKDEDDLVSDDANAIPTQQSVKAYVDNTIATGFLHPGDNISLLVNDVPYIIAETDPIFLASDAYSIISTQISNWDIAYGWGDHSLIGYLTVETDPIFIASDVYGVTTTDIGNWDDAYTDSHTHTNKTLLDSLTAAGGGTQALFDDGIYKPVSNTIGGSDSYVQYNDGGILGGDITFTFNDVTKTLLTTNLTLTQLDFNSTPSTTYILEDGSANLSFTDAVSGTYTLADLVGGGVIPISDILEWYGTGSYYRPYTVQTTGCFDSSVTNPSHTTRLNYDGYLYITKLVSGIDIIVYGLNIGRGAGSVINNTIFGSNTFIDNVTGTHNTAIGYSSLSNSITGTYNTAIGTGTLYNNVSGSYNTAIGISSLGGLQSTNYNTAVGACSLQYCLTGVSNTAIGYGALLQGTGSNNIAVGYYAGFYETGSNKLFIDNQSRINEADARVKALIYGIFDASTVNQYLTVNGNVVVSENLTVVKKLTVAGLIDPTGLQLTPVAANPGDANTIWSNSTTSNVLYYGSTPMGLGSIADDILDWDGTKYTPYTSITGTSLVLSTVSTTSTQNATGYLNVNGQLVVGSSHTSNNRIAISGQSYSSTGVLGTSYTSYGVAGVSTNSVAVYGQSSTSIGVLGASTSETGVYGQSVSSYGVYGVSENVSIYGETDIGTAAMFEQNGITDSTSLDVVYIRKTGDEGSYNMTGNLLFLLDDSSTSGTISGSSIKCQVDFTERIDMNPRVAATGGTAYIFDTHNALTTSDLFAIKNQGNYKTYVTSSGKILYTAGTSATCVIVPGVIKDFYNDATTSGTGQTTLYSYTVPANTLATNGDKLKAVYFITGTCTGVSQYHIDWAGAHTIGTASVTAATVLEIAVEIIRVSSSVLRFFVSYEFHGNPSAPVRLVGEVTGEDFTVTNTLVLSAAAADGTVTAKFGYIEYKPGMIV